MKFDDFMRFSAFELSKEEKQVVLLERLRDLTAWHKENCRAYDLILSGVSYFDKKVSSYMDLPFLPVRMFKERDLKSVSNDEIVKTMTSSGTTGQQVSKIYLNSVTASNQQKAMVKIVSDFIGSTRMPMIILDCPSVLKDRKKFSARGAAILGFSIFATKKMYALDDNMVLDIQGIIDFLKMHKDEKIILFGFTYIIWEFFYKELQKYSDQTGEKIDLSDAILIHGGGWKKLTSKKVSSDIFRKSLLEVCNLSNIHDYYGMVEQTGSIYMECQYGHLHASIFSDVIIRNPIDFSVCKNGEKGIIQVVSVIPESYPGHSILTEDEGRILGEDDCPCGRKGKYFEVLGRIKDAELRGCSDTFEVNRYSKLEDNNGTLSTMKFLIGNNRVLEQIQSVAAFQPFEEKIILFLEDISKILLGDRSARKYPDVVTLGFWIRKAALYSQRDRFDIDSEHQLRLGRGVVFHIAPSNVPINFAYSLFASVLVGNPNIVRVPTNEFPQINIVCNAIEQALSIHEFMRPYIVLVRYQRQKEINDLLSKMCDVRVIWGGDNTIDEIRCSKIASKTTEVLFADRYSLAIINSDKYISLKDKDKVAKDFYNDTFLTDQNACTSPKVVVWTGQEKKVAKEIFWEKLNKLVRQKYVFQPIQAVDKLLLTCMVFTDSQLCKEGYIRRLQQVDNYITRIQVDSVSEILMKYQGNSGFFYEYDCDSIMDLWPLCNNIKCQTVGIIGDVSEIQPLLFAGIKGIDRIVPIGRTMDFDLFWDGYNLVERLTRSISIK